MDKNLIVQLMRARGLGTPERDWEEDFPLENGQYMNHCVYCNETFIGYKRRLVCKLCFKPVPLPVVDNNVTEDKALPEAPGAEPV